MRESAIHVTSVMLTCAIVTDDAMRLKDHGWRPVMGIDSESGESVTVDFFTKTEIAAVKYAGGRFVSHSSNTDFERFWSKALERGGITTDITDLDPMMKNGFGYYLTGGVMILGWILCGYGQACADTQAKEMQRRIEDNQVVHDDEEKAKDRAVDAHHENVSILVDHMIKKDQADYDRGQGALSPSAAAKGSSTPGRNRTETNASFAGGFANDDNSDGSGNEF